MRLLQTLIFLFILPLTCNASSQIDPQPSDWPTGPDQTTCSFVAGQYLDPNTVRGSTITYHNEHMWSETGGTPEIAWLVFGFLKKGVSADRRVGGRSFTLEFNSQNSLVITYFINGKVISTKEISASDYRCEKGVLKFVSYYHQGQQIFDMFPNKGSIVYTIEMFRAQDYLYVKSESEAKAVFFGLIPLSHTSLGWPRFPAMPSAVVPTIPPSRYFLWDIEKKGSRVEGEFIVTQQRNYQFDLEFHCNGMIDAWRNFMGTGQFDDPNAGIFFTIDPIHPIRVFPDNAGDIDRFNELHKKGMLVKKNAKPGIVVPIHVRVEKIDGASGNNTELVDETVYTEALSHAGGNVFSRKIVGINLIPGRYKFSATTLNDVPLPTRTNPETFTALGITYDTNTK